MNYSDPNIKYILDNINMLKLLRDINNLVGSRDNVQLSTVDERLNPNNNASFATHIKSLSQHGYIEMHANKRREDGTANYDEITLEITTEGKTVCGFIMTVLLDFHRSQLDSPRY